MAITVPTALTTFDHPLEPGEPLRAQQMQSIAENGHLLRSRLRGVLSIGAESFTTTSTSYVTIADELPFTASTLGSGYVEAVARCDNTTLSVEVTDGTTTVSASGASGAGPVDLALSVNVTTLSGTDWRVKVEHKVSSGTSTLTALDIYERAHVAGTIA